MQLRYPFSVGSVKVNNIKEFIALADSGNAEVQNKLGECFFSGMGVPKDIKKSWYYLELALAQNNSQAMLNLGFFYRKGIGCTRDLLMAEKLYKRSYELGDKEAAGCLGEMYLYGMGPIMPDVKKGFMLIKEGYDYNYSQAKGLVMEFGSFNKFMELHDYVTNPSTSLEEIDQMNKEFLKLQPAEYRN